MKTNLAKRIVEPGDLTELGVNGFGLRSFVVRAALKNHGTDINGAARQVIEAWSETCKKDEAYYKMYEAIKKINKAAWLEVLE